MKQASIANEACFIGQRSKLRLAMKQASFGNEAYCVFILFSP